jgi:YHS domain-containing protein
MAILDAPHVGTVTEVIGVAKDPVCGMDVDERKAPATAQYKGHTYYFCSKGCKAAFDKDPERFVSGRKA